MPISWYWFCGDVISDSDPFAIRGYYVKTCPMRHLLTDSIIDCTFHTSYPPPLVVLTMVTTMAIRCSTTSWLQICCYADLASGNSKNNEITSNNCIHRLQADPAPVYKRLTWHPRARWLNCSHFVGNWTSRLWSDGCTLLWNSHWLLGNT